MPFRSILAPILLVPAFFVLALVVNAWTDPTAAPPTCPTAIPGCNTPLNVSSTAQGKAGSLNVGSVNAPGATLEVTSAFQNGIRLKKTAGTAGSVDLFVAVSTASQTPAVACTTIVATAACLGGWNPTGTTNVGCAGAAAIGNRALCADFGD